MNNGLICKVKSIDGKKAIVEIDGQVLEVAKEKLPSKIKEGEEIKLFALDSKSILEEILNGD